MGRKTGRAPLVLAEEEKKKLEQWIQSEELPREELIRATILLKFSQGWSISEIQRQVGLSRPTIYKCIDRALSGDVAAGINPFFRRGPKPEIDRKSKEWILALASTRPTDHGFSTGRWSLSKLTDVIRKKAEMAGFPRLANVSRMTVWRILDGAHVKLRLDEGSQNCLSPSVTTVELLVFCHKIKIPADSSPGDPAPPLHSRERSSSSASEETDCAAILAALDLHTGKIFASLEDRIRGRELSELMKRVDSQYPPSALLRIIIDNQSIQFTRETVPYLAKDSRRFEILQTSWLNLLESTFSRIAASFLSQIPSCSKDELKDRFLEKVREWNDHPESGLPEDNLERLKK